MPIIQTQTTFSQAVFNISERIYSGLVLNSHLLWDSVREKNRYEQAAAIVYYFSLYPTGKNDQIPSELVSHILKNQNADGWWDECAYSVQDEPQGFSGLVTTSYVLIALAEYYRLTNKKEVLDAIIKASDAIYFRENNGHVVKAIENKSDVINTNLLGAIAIDKVNQILPLKSNRRNLFNELTLRIIRKSLSYQAPSGFFPYHHHTNAVPFLYHAMVTAQLHLLSQNIESGVLDLAIKKASDALETIFDETGKIRWERANNHDKKGAIWAYSFSCASPISKELKQKILTHLESSLTNNLLPTTLEGDTPDTFYSSWALFGLTWSLITPRKTLVASGLDQVKFIIFKFFYFAQFARFVFLYLKNRLDNFLFNAGALENRKWKS